MIFYGWGTKATPLGITDVKKCDRCGNSGPWLVYESKKQFKLYWIPVAQWNKHYAASCMTCPNTWEIPRENLDKVLAEGEKNNENRFIKTAAAILKSVAKVGGVQSQEWARAIEHLISISDDTISRQEADKFLREATQTEIDPHLFEESDRFVLLSLAIDVTMADGTIDLEEIKALESLAARLLLPVEAVQILIDRLTGEDSEMGRNSAETARSYQVLGLEPGASPAEIRSAYKRLMRQHHPDLAAPADRDEATIRSQEIIAAYHHLIGQIDGKSQTSSGQSQPPPRQDSPPPRQDPPKTQSNPPPKPPSKSPDPGKPKYIFCGNPECKEKLSETTKFCGKCGHRRREFCSSCGKISPPGSRFCVHDGSKFE